MSKSNTWGDWLEGAIIKTEEFAKQAQVIAVAASKIAQDGAIELGKQAKDLRDKYDLDMMAGGPADSRRNGGRIARKSVLDLVYVTENLISMSFPYDFKKNGRQHGQEGNDINIVSKFLKQKHGSHFMIWNVSEESYDYSLFGDQVLEYSFPGHPAPPLGLLFKICMSVESWLDADEKNVAVVHCLTGKGRTAALMSCILTWIREFSSPLDALQYVAERRGVSVDYLTIPSQRRYVQYFTSMLAGTKPLPAPLLLMRIIMNTIPNFSGNSRFTGCCPYIQVFQNGKLIATAAPPGNEKQNESTKSDRLTLKWMNTSDGNVSFILDCAVRGDLLLRCRHADSSGSKVSIFRAAIHTGYIPPSGILRLLKCDLDGACSDSKFEEDFFIDLMFAPMTYEKNNGEKVISDAKTGVIDDTGSRINFTDMANGELGRFDTSVDMRDTSIGLPNSSTSPVLHRPSASSKEKEGREREGRDTDKEDKDIDLWDAVLAKRLRHEKMGSRKYVTQSNRKDQFSISDDVIRSASNDSHEATAGPIAPSVSNEELIMQIARLEREETGEEKNDTEKEKTTTEDRETTENNGDDNQMEDYDEDYYVSLDDIYPQESDFVTVNDMTGEYNNNPDPIIINISPIRSKVTPVKEVKEVNGIKSDELDDFQVYLESVKEDVNGQNEKKTERNSGVIVPGIHTVSSSGSIKSKNQTDDNAELDELERYLLNLNGP